MIKVYEQWVEAFSVLLIVAGFLVAVLLQSPFLSLLVVFLAGFISGRVFFVKRNQEPLFPFVLIIIGFLLGYLIGGFWVRRTLILAFFFAGFVLSYYLHTKKIITIFKSEGFIK